MFGFGFKLIKDGKDREKIKYHDRYRFKVEIRNGSEKNRDGSGEKNESTN